MANPVPTGSPHKQHRTFLIVGFVALILFVGNVTSNLIATDLDPILKPYRKYVYIFFAVALIVFVVAKIRDARRGMLSSSADGYDSLSTAQPRDGHRWQDKTNNIRNGPTTTSLHQLPSAERDFTGRSNDLTDLKDAIEKYGATICGLRGMGGIGKTALALKLAEHLIPRYPDAQFYLDLKGASPNPLSVADAMTHVIRAYRPHEEVPKVETELSALYRTLLHGKRALLLMDNAASRDQVAPLIPSSVGMLIVTSRHRFTIAGMFTKDLDSLSAADARDLLLKVEPRINELADPISELCGYLPLALRLAASLIKERIDLDPADYVLRLTNPQHRLKLIDGSLNLSYEILDPKSKKRWRDLAVFPDTFDVRAAGAVWETGAADAAEVLSTLVAYSLVEWNPATRRHHLHDLARLFAAARLSETERNDCLRLHASHYRAVIAEANEIYEQGGTTLKQGFALLDLEWSNIEAGQAWASKSMGDDAEAAKLSNEFPDLGQAILNLRMHPRERIRWVEAGLGAARILADRSAEARHLVHLGRAYYTLDGNSEHAINLYEQALAIAREIGDRDSEGQAMGNLGIVYRESGTVIRAIEIFKARLEIAREIKDRRSEGNTLGNLGRSYWVIGEPLLTIQYCEEQLRIARELGNRRSEAQAMGNIGQAFRVLGKLEEAIELHKLSLSIQREIENSRGEGGALGDLGKTYERKGEIRTAIGFYEQSLAIQCRVGYRRGQGYALGNLGKAYYRLKDFPRALEYHQQHLRLALEAGDRIAEGIAKFSISCVLHKQGDDDGACAGAEEALKIFERIEDSHAEMVRKRLADWRCGENRSAPMSSTSVTNKSH